MGVRISTQLLLFAQSILLGLCAGAVYGVLRPIRRLSPRLAVAADFLYALAAAAAGSAFLLRPADGILRGYMALGALGGGALWFCGFDAAARPLWVFWTEAALWLLSLALLPVKLTASALASLWESGRNLLYFQEKRCGIRFGYTRQRRTVLQKRRQSQHRGGRDTAFHSHFSPYEGRRQPHLRGQEMRPGARDGNTGGRDRRPGARNSRTGSQNRKTGARDKRTGTRNGKAGARNSRTGSQNGKTGARVPARQKVQNAAKVQRTRHSGAAGRPARTQADKVKRRRST